ncbi:MAG: response regulator transcription factor [Magnetococcales bacterium]|nr:response regulator transcription factor [Magnetococcales bacterium]
MRTLIADDDLSSRRLLEGILAPYGECVLAETSNHAVELFKEGYDMGKPFQLVCLDIMMPDIDGQAALAKMRDIEKEKKIAPNDQSVVIMVTALNSMQTVVSSFEGGGCNAYLTKPITKRILLEKIKKYGLIE